MFLKKFVDDLAVVDSEENKERLIMEAINDEDIIDNEDAEVMDLFGNNPRPEVSRTIDPEFEKILVSMEIPDNMPETHKRDYITDMIDKSMGIEHPDPIITIPTTEAAGDVKIDSSKTGKVLTMKTEDKNALMTIINTYNEDVQNKTKNGNILKTFIREVLKNINSTGGKISASVSACIDLMYSKFCLNSARAQVAQKADNNRGKDEDATAELKAKLNDIVKNIH